MGAYEDKQYLLDLAGMYRVDGEVDRADELEAIAGRIENPEVEVVEQTTLGRKSPGAPDGWSWSDIPTKPWTGKFSGIRLTKGEPFIEQQGHTLLVRQGETSLPPRYVGIYEQITRAGVVKDSIFIPTVHVLVVFGFQGARRGFVTFSDGKQGPWREGDAQAITDYITSWLHWTWENIVVPREQPKRGPRQPRLTDDPGEKAA